LKALFKKAAEVMMSVIVDPKTVRCNDDIRISVEGMTVEELFLRNGFLSIQYLQGQFFPSSS
jgi:SHS2 domain-containing protein